jgi:hypothetical protein
MAQCLSWRGLILHSSHSVDQLSKLVHQASPVSLHDRLSSWQRFFFRASAGCLWLTQAPDCASVFCSQCSTIGDLTISSCCAASTQASCFNSEYGNSSTLNQDVLLCSSAYSIIFSCVQSTTSFRSLGDSAKASCLCYSTGGDSSVTWIPNVFDGYWSACYAAFLTEDPSDAATITALASMGPLCSSVGNILEASATATITATGNASSSAALSPSISAAVAQTSILPTATARVSGTVAIAPHEVYFALVFSHRFALCSLFLQA